MQDFSPEAVILSGYNFVSSRFSSQILKKESTMNAFGKSSDKKSDISFLWRNLARESFIHWFQKCRKHLQLTQLKGVSVKMYISEPFRLGYCSCFCKKVTMIHPFFFLTETETFQPWYFSCVYIYIALCRLRSSNRPHEFLVKSYWFSFIIWHGVM